jgi:Domain of unknown function (DUF1707)
VGETPSPNLRIGDPEREEAMRVLGEHLSVGRLDIDEYGERTTRASAAKTRGELIQLFADLPEPHPRLDRPLAADAAADGSRRALARTAEKSQVVPRIASALVPLSALLAVALFFGVGTSWLVFLLPAAIAVITGALWGEQHKQHKRDRHRLH